MSRLKSKLLLLTIPLCRNLESLVQAEVAQGIDSKRVLIAGFSQGGAVSLLMLRSRLQVAAVLAMSTWLPLAEEKPLVSAQNQQTPVLMCHGNKDGVVSKVPTAAENTACGLNDGADANCRCSMRTDRKAFNGLRPLALQSSSRHIKDWAMVSILRKCRTSQAF